MTELHNDRNYDCPKCGKKEGLRPNGWAGSGRRRWRCVDYSLRGRGLYEYCYSTTNPLAPPKDQAGRPKVPDKKLEFKRSLRGLKRFVITAAQNATPAHEGFLAALERYCETNAAELVIVPIRYKNPTSRWSASQAGEQYWEVPSCYLYNQRKKLNENLVLLGDIKTQPTAQQPLTGFESVTHGESGILAHTKLQLKCVPTPQGRYAKILTTTGACTVANYTDTAAGKKGEFHHSLSAVAVEIKGKKFFMRHLCAKSDGSFIDLDMEYTPEGPRAAPRPLALVLGDTHRATMCPKVEVLTFGEHGIVDQLDPEHLVFHDLHDGESTNHHEKKDPFAQVRKRASSMHLVKQEIEDDVAWLERVCKERVGIIVPSNHDDFLARWLREQDWRQDPDNAEFYLETALKLVRDIKAGNEAPHPFTHWVRELKSSYVDIRPLERDESFQLGGVELAMHGDLGPNGARGSRMNLRRIGVKSMIGHSHTPGIEEGCWQVGTSSKLRAGYNRGPSSWMNCHGLVHANGKRQLLFIIDGAWRL